MVFRKSQSALLSGGRTDLTPHSVVISIDRTLQTIVEQELAVQMKMSRPKSGTVIVQDPQTGEILAMATAPAFNPNLWGSPMQPSDYGPELLKNPAVEHVFEPGSTFKIVTAAAALEEHRVTPTDTFFCENGSWDIPGRTIHDHEHDGWLTFAQIISHSSNIGTAKVARRLGRDPLYRYARAFGFGMPTGCGLAGRRRRNFAPDARLAPEQPGDHFFRTGSGSDATANGERLQRDRQRRLVT